MSWEILAWCCTAASLVGAWLNARKRIEGFYVWGVTNIVWILYFVMQEQWALACLFAAYLAICVHGIVVWRRR